MENNAFASFLSSLVSDVDSKRKERKYEPKEPHHILQVGEGIAELAVWKSVSKRGRRSVRFNLRKRDAQGKLRSSLDSEDLPEIVVSLLSFCRKLSTADEWVDDKTRARLSFLVDSLDAVESAAKSSNGEATRSDALFDSAI